MKVLNEHEFGGPWTQEKLERIRSYLIQYMTIFTKNPAASFYTTIYVDAFAGSGYRTETKEKHESDDLFPELNETEAQDFLKGSAWIALEVEPSFDRFIFVEKSADRVDDLNNLKREFPKKADPIEVFTGDANDKLIKWCRETDWHKNRAVVFLDPYGMQVTWDLMETMARTQAIDLWILFPLGVAVNRMLTKGELPPEKWASHLTRFFGSDDWKEEFYHSYVQPTLFGDETTFDRKDAPFKKIGDYFVRRLKTVFADVAENPLALLNSKNVPLFLLCFAAGNPRGAPIAKRIASYILRA